jgi:DNA polymerase-3 subunit alpha
MRDPIPDNDKEIITVFIDNKAAGLRPLIRELKPDNLDDLININAFLYLDFPEYTSWFFGKKNKCLYPDPYYKVLLKKYDALEETRGVIVYDEQIIELCKSIAGYGTEDAVFLLSIMKQKKGSPGEKTLIKSKTSFIQAAQSRGLNKAERVFDILYSFAGFTNGRGDIVIRTIKEYRKAYLAIYNHKYYSYH